MALTGWDGVHDFLSFLLIINFESEEVPWSSKLELGGIALLVVFNDDFLGFWQVLLLSSHDLDEFLQVLDFLWLYKNKNIYENGYYFTWITDLLRLNYLPL